MLLTLLAFAGGMLTILSPCILPVVPLVFARVDQSFVRHGVPLLAGMALTFAAVASLAVAGGAWVAHVNEYGRWIALAFFAVFGAALLFPSMAERLTHPLVNLGNRLDGAVRRDGGEPRVMSSVVLGVATGLLWAPCAGPILGLVMTGVILHRPGGAGVLPLLAFAAGAAASLAILLAIGGRVVASLRRSYAVSERVRQVLGAAVVLSAAAIALGFDTRVLALLPSLNTTGIEEKLVQRWSPRAGSRGVQAEKVNAQQVDSKAGDSQAADSQAADSQAMNAEQPNAGALLKVSMTAEPAAATNPTPAAAKLSLPAEGTMPSLSGAVDWLNSPPLKTSDLRGKVVIVNFWTYSCINCLRTLPYLKAWSNRYRDQGLVVIGVHAPEFAFEHNIANVKRAAADLHIDYPIAIDNNLAVWQAFDNQYWPAFYIVDARGEIRYHHFGEGGYDESEAVIRQLLADAGHSKLPASAGAAKASGVEAAADPQDLRSGETYVGYRQAEGFASPETLAPDMLRAYSSPARLRTGSWSLDGEWNVAGERAQSGAGGAKIAYRFHARDLHLVLGPMADGKPVRFRVTLDGKPPGASHGADTDANGVGVVDKERLYQLVRQSGAVQDRTFEIEFLDAGASAYAFTFG
ncbi:cytochrome C biogenesis protein [Paraburkholderia graminis]|uniref:cytochrome c biogenesis protein DipZ n=1 Tax=Paraburkholderia graminis TaxID=60548 RepID=UPI000DEF4A4F|nr:cytochrome c biogenesis protein DipZ [Paraburkholderia graminis]AXF11656.1 cytochrome C biogenesis protein [Paraburkholderia graminis]MDR6471317.1 cytochrome c biogenesis protein CcdA/thiol-disulfide isomerase/thioredoxin [Paraburkholderia graminis]